jgi:hypothetical protein
MYGKLILADLNPESGIDRPSACSRILLQLHASASLMLRFDRLPMFGLLGLLRRSIYY